MTYPEQINLPFNFSSIRGDFLLYPSPEHQSHGDGPWVIIQGSNVLLVSTDQGLELPEGELPAWLSPQQQPPLCIGTWQGRPLRACTVSSGISLQSPFLAEPFNAAGNTLDIRTLTLAGLAKQILHWDRQGRHCPACGAATHNLTGSWGRRCSACQAEHFPHIHPCAIVLVKRGEELLLTRKAEWAPGRYSLVAGFLDFGESLEECAMREIREETGIIARNIRYVGSQNWPFPAQLMAGFVAEYADGEIAVDHHELEDARWFHRDALPILPPPRSIARWIIDNFK